MRRAGAIALGLAVLLAAAPAAPAARHRVTRGPVGPFAVAGDAVAYVDLNRGTRVRVKRPGSSSHIVFTQRVPSGFFGSIGPLVASPTSLALIATEQRGDDESPNFARRHELWAGPLDGPLASVSRGQEFAACTPHPAAAAVAQDTLVWRRDTCAGGSILARDLRTGAERTLTTGAHLRDVLAAGRFALWTENAAEPQSFPAPATVVVYDLVANREAYRVSEDPRRLVVELDIQDDGKVILVGRRVTSPTGADEGDFFDWYSVAEPSPHPIPVSSAFTLPQLGGDRILLSRFASRTSDELVLSDLSGRLTTIARFPRRGLGIDTDFDGRTAAYVEQDCPGPTLYAQDVTTTTSPEGSTAAACPVRIRGGTVLVHGGKADVRLTCPRGCAGTAELRAGGRRIAPLRRLRITATSGRVPFTLDRRARRALVRAGSLHATVTVRNKDRDDRSRRTTRRILLDP